MKGITFAISLILATSAILLTSSVSCNNEGILKLDVASVDNTKLLGTENGSEYKYVINNSNFLITDINNKKLKWRDLINSKRIEVHYWGDIIETFPATFTHICKIIIIN